MELTRKLTLENHEIEALKDFLCGILGGDIEKLIEKGQITSDAAGIVSDIYAAIED